MDNLTDLLRQIDQLQAEIDRYRPLDRHLLNQLKQYYRIGLTYSSNALEGNSLTETETKVVLEDGITIGGKSLKDHYEAAGHSDAFDLMYKLAARKLVAERDIKMLHRLFYYRIDPSQAGKYRKVKLVISGSKYPLPPPEEISRLMQVFLGRLQEWRVAKHPVETAALAHKDLVFIHPFIDGNGRVARLVMNLLLLQLGYNIAIISPVLRQEYLQTLEKAHQDEKDFITVIARMVKETQKDYLRLFKD